MKTAVLKLKVLNGYLAVAKVWSTVNNKVRETYGYIPGMGSDDPLPFTDHVSKAKWL
nr:hypothetical protein [uncultured Methanobrevibacter sp.]